MDRFLDTEFARLTTANMAAEFKETGTKMYQFNGVWLADTNVREEVLVDLQNNWEARSDDAYIVSYPKAGTTWAQEIMFLAMNNADVERTKKGHTMLRIPYLEANINPPKGHIPEGIAPVKIAKIIPSPRLLKSHLPFQLLPPDIMKKKAKIVYVARNPKDLAVSFYIFHKWMVMLPTYSSWDEYFQDFMDGKLCYGHWYEHYLSFWNRRHEDNILFIKYEDMKKDHRGTVKQISEFLGFNHSDEMLDKITEHSTFAAMKANPMTNPDSLFTEKSKKNAGKDISFMRKGKVGDWKNFFTDEQSDALDAICKEKLEVVGLKFDF